jgi:hypothetical protein
MAVGDASGCGGGTIEIMRAPDRHSILSIKIYDMNIDGELVSPTAHFDPGTVPIGESGLFETYFGSGLPGQEISLSGELEPVYGPMSGLIGIAPSACGYFGYTAYQLLIVDTNAEPQPPNVGYGPSQPAGRGLAWPLFVLGAGAVLAGLILRPGRD